MEIFKTHLFFSGHDEDHPYLIDTIFHEGHWWLVATWLQNHATGHRIPERIIQMDGLTVRFQEVDGEPYHFLLNNALPKSVLDGEPQSGYVIAIHPHALLHTQGPKSIQ
jgi:hypothetical protein